MYVLAPVSLSVPLPDFVILVAPTILEEITATSFTLLAPAAMVDALNSLFLISLEPEIATVPRVGVDTPRSKVPPVIVSAPDNVPAVAPSPIVSAPFEMKVPPV